ncbi:FAT-domain-containing protein [Phellopilus nigrolimitatus]|nr:FAT-domain-containing protein [Phellopilus nigrolimitatus]
MDAVSHVPASALDLESRAARIADPANPLKLKYDTACELREMVDSVRDVEAARIFPHMLSVLLDTLRNTEPSFRRASLEFQFRRVLVEIIHRIPPSEAFRPHVSNMLATIIYILRHDSEDNAATCLKTLHDVVRAVKGLPEEPITELLLIFLQMLRTMPSLVVEFFSEDSNQVDSSVVFPAARSFKVLTEIPFIVVIFVQNYRHLTQPLLSDILNATLDATALESSIQKTAREDYEAMGGIWAGEAPNMKNRAVYSDFIIAQIKLINFVTFLLRTQPEAYGRDNRGDDISVYCVRLLQDCPIHMSVHRKELTVVLRHQVASPYRRAFLPHIEKLLYERVLVGAIVGIQETTRYQPYGTVFELTSGLRDVLSNEQLSRIVQTFSHWFLGSTFPLSVQLALVRMIYSMTDTIIQKLPQADATELFTTILQCYVGKVKSLDLIFQDVGSRLETSKDQMNIDKLDVSFIEKDRPVSNTYYATENPADILRELRVLFRYILHGIKACINSLKGLGASLPDGEIMIPFFERSIHIVSFYEVVDFKEEKDALDALAGILQDLDLHVFQELWAQRLDLYFKAVVKRPSLLHLSQVLFAHTRISQTVVSTTLRHLSDRLDELGGYDDTSAAIVLRFFKMTFTIVGLQPEINEPVLATHLGRLIMDSFPLAAKAARPIYYFHLMRALFRAIGSGAGRYEQLYKEVLPLLPEMLDCLNRQLLAADAQTRDLLVELCLTVPLRLTHLLPHLHYLMKPLVLALQGGTELVSQGLRTLELCIDNLIGDFLDPILRPVLRELMEALHSHLRPLPGNHHHAHTTIRILGKLGGRNRRLLDEKPSLSYKPYADPAKIAVSLSGRQEYIQVGPIAELSARILAKSNAPDKTHAYNYLEHMLTNLLNEGLEGRDRENIFIRGVEGLFDAIHVPHVQERAEEYLRTLSRHVFTLEARRALAKDVSLRRFPSHMFGLYLDAFPHALARTDEHQAKRAAEILRLIVHDLVPIGYSNGLKPIDLLPILHMVATRFSTLCFDEAWVRKSAGCTGMMIMTSTPEVGEKWTITREIDIVRTLLHVLKDSPHDPPRNVSDIIENLVCVLRMTNNNHGNQMEVDGAPPPVQSRIPFLIGIFFNEVASAHPVVRQTARSCIKLLSELSGRPVVELLLPHRDRVMTSIFVKPLRSLPHPIIVGQVEAVRYCISLDPPLLEMNEELIRLLHEALALADNSDMSLVAKIDVRKSSLEVVQLRVACLKLLSAALPLTDCFSRVPHTRQRVTGVYFKSLYNPSKEVSDAAHEGLRIILIDQSRFPKELLQTGLRPILMNLSDTKKLSIADLDGLSRLLRLLANYFKVEIGVKLLDHFRAIAEPQMLLASARVPLSENDAINKLVRLVNIFHLLPQTAVVYMKELVPIVVQTEAHLHSSTQSPFSEPLGKYLDRNTIDAVDYFLSCLNQPRFVRTLRNTLNSRMAPKLLREFAVRSWVIARVCFRSGDVDTVLPGLLLCADIAELTPGWTKDNDVIDALLDLWNSEPEYASNWGQESQFRFRRYDLMISMFMKAMVESPRIDILFDIISIYSMNVAMDLSELTRFLYKHVSLDGTMLFRRNILTRFLTWFDDQSVSWSRKTSFLRYVISPMILVHLCRSHEDGLIDRHIIERFHARLWIEGSGSAFADADDFFKIEILHLTTVMVHHRPQLLVDVKKDVIKFAWLYISNDDQTVKQVANLLAARFFETYETPAKFFLSAWTGLLKPPHAEGGQKLARQALDIISPILQRMPPDPGQSHWARTTRRLLAEEGNGMSQVSVIYQLISRQPELFYPCRSLFIPHIINTLPKLGIHLSASSEGRILSLDILDVIYKWEQKSLRPGENPSGWVTSLGFREAVVSYLTRIATGPQDAQTKTNIVARALALLKDFLNTSGWGEVAFKLDYFRKALCEMEFKEDTAPTIFASARVLQVVCANKPDSWFTQNVKILQKLVQKGMLLDEPVMLDTLHPIVERLLQIYPLPKEDENNQSEVAEFHTFIYNTISEGLKSMPALRGALLMLTSVVQVVPERIEPFATSLMRLLGKLTKEHISSPPNPPNSENYDAIVRMLVSILKICQNSSTLPSDQRRLHLGNLIILVEKSASPTLCQFLLDTARDWALSRRDAYPTMKEKASLLQKMTTFETRGIDLFNQYLELIYDIYTEPSLRRSDLTSRLEQAFILGCRSHDTSLRERFIDLLDSSIPRSLTSRLTYILGVQSWDALADCNWTYLALDLLLSSVDTDMPLTSSPSVVFTQTSSPLAQTIANSRIRDIVRPMRRLLYYGMQAAHDTWVSVFSAIWSSLTRKEQGDVTHHMVILLSREYHIRQSEMRPNVIQALLEGIHACSPPMSLPPHLLKYLAKTFGAWHVALEHLQSSLDFVRDDDGTVRDSVYDALAEVYAELVEEDMFYGLWRRRSLHNETNVAITYEQNGMWPEAQIAYEQAQSRARNNSIPFTESEYCLWEDHWIIATEKMQQWDVLYELARNDGNHELLLEAAWRNKDWADKDSLQLLEEQIQSMSDVATPRRRVYEAFIALVKTPGAVDRNIEFTRILEDAMQLSLRKWIAFPPKMSACHIPLLQHFQQFVELQEAVQIFGSLASTTPQNLERKSGDLKLVLQAWRERLPNLHDDISVWSDLVAWRQNVFSSINKQYIPLIQVNGQNGAQANAANTFGYRGYHETAWIINRFAHVARKHDLFDVAQLSLTKIYELPNIEISEAFLKLREEARCRLQVPEKLLEGLNLINNTNLMYFSTPQKAEFYTLKGMFYSALNQNDEAEACFGQAVQLDMNVAKAWSEWGRYNDKMFSNAHSEVKFGAHAVSCYIQAAGLYKNTKSRPLLTRVLWLLTIDDPIGTIAEAFSTYTGDRALWYWITLIPQLLFSLSFGEAPQAQRILVELAKTHPQALFFPLRTTKEDLANLRKQLAQTQAQTQAQEAAQRMAMQANHNSVLASQNAASSDGMAAPSAPSEGHVPANGTSKEDWELVDDIASLLKTNNPLLALTLETMVDQFSIKFKATPEEEIYRFTFMLLQDAAQNCSSRASNPNDDGALSEQIVKNISRMAIHLAGQARKDYDQDFILSKPRLQEYIHRLQHWRDRYETFLDSRPRVQPLDLLSHWLVEFQYTKFDEVEVPGQYLELVDNNSQFSRIRQFGPKFEICRGQGYCYKRFVIHGHDGVHYTFAVQQPAARWCRREERVMQLFRTFNHALTRRKESRKRNLQFHLPLAVSLNPQVRLFLNDPSYVSLQDIYDQHCEEIGVTREDPALMVAAKTKEIMSESNTSTSNNLEYNNVRKAVFDEVCKKMVPEDVLSRYMTRTMCSPQELWRMRKAFTLQLAAVSFMTYIVCITSRQPPRFHISRATGQIYMSEILPGVSSQNAQIAHLESVPFRFTPNLQHFVNPTGTEALFCPAIVAIARALTKPEYELDQHLCLFIRDEVLTWSIARGKRNQNQESIFRLRVFDNTVGIVGRAELMACKLEKAQDPKDDKVTQSMQSVTNLISQAANPLKLALMSDLYCPWF